jgi:hypothetical protein
MVIAGGGREQKRTANGEKKVLKGEFGWLSGQGLAGQPGSDSGTEGVEGVGHALKGRGLVERQKGCPPADANADVANDEEGGEGNGDEENDCACPAQALLEGVTAEHAGFSDIGGKGSPTSVVVDDLA